MKKLSELHDDLPFLSNRMKIGKVGKLAANLYEKNRIVIRIINLKQANLKLKTKTFKTKKIKTL